MESVPADSISGGSGRSDGLNQTLINDNTIFDGDEQAQNIIKFSVITNDDGPLTKTISPDGKGSINKTPAARLIRGKVETKQMQFADFGPFLRTLKTNQAIAHGISGHERCSVVAEAIYNGVPGTITRTQKFFQYPEGAGIGLFDHDPKPGQKTLSPDEFIDIVSRIWPDFSAMPTWWTPSTSSCIFDLEGKQLTGPGAGWHLYFPFEPANKLPQLATWLFKQLWIAGHGHIFMTLDGKLLERTIFDAAVFSPERLDFVAGAVCIGCEQHLPAPVYRMREEVIA